MLLSPLIVCNAVISRASEENLKDLTPLKLQKLLYFISGRYIAESDGAPLFAENFVAWQLGPVLTSVYFEFKGFGSERITRYSCDANGIVYFPNSKSKINELFFSVMNRQFKKYKKFSPSELSALTHAEGSPWFTTNCNGVIENQKIYDYFKENVDK